MTQIERQVLSLIENNPMISQLELANRLQLTREEVAAHVSSLVKKGHIAGKGYVLSTDSYAVVVGGVNVDIGGHAAATIVNADSNPGTVRVSLGGVGRNIAHNMALLGLNVRMLTAYGDDLYGQKVAASWTDLGIDAGRALRLPDAATSTYLYIADQSGEMVVAISDMTVCDQITPDYLEANLDLLNNAQVVVVDANIPEASVRYLAENCKAPLFCDPVSTVKAKKMLPILDKIHTLKPNHLEAEILSGVTIFTEEDVEEAALVLLQKGVRRVFISMGAAGVYAATKREQYWLPNLPGKMVNTTGCGDAFMAALVWAYLEGTDLRNTALAGLAAGAVTLESAETINPAMSADALRQRMKNE